MAIVQSIFTDLKVCRYEAEMSRKQKAKKEGERDGGRHCPSHYKSPLVLCKVSRRADVNKGKKITSLCARHLVILSPPSPPLPLLPFSVTRRRSFCLFFSLPLMVSPSTSPLSPCCRFALSHPVRDSLSSLYGSSPSSPRPCRCRCAFSRPVRDSFPSL